MKYVEIYQLQPGQSCAYLSDYKRNLSIRVLVSALRKNIQRDVIERLSGTRTCQAGL